MAPISQKKVLTTSWLIEELVAVFTRYFLAILRADSHKKALAAFKNTGMILLMSSAISKAELSSRRGKDIMLRFRLN